MSSLKSSSSKKATLPRKRNPEKKQTKKHIKIDPYQYKPMLLKEDSTKLGQEGWVGQIKEDGTRIVATLTKDKGWFITTKGLDKAIVLPELEGIGKGLNFKKKVVLDCEGVVLKNGISDYPSGEKRFGRSKELTLEEKRDLMERYPVSLIVFDVLEVDEVDLTQKSKRDEKGVKLKERMKILQKIFEGNTNPHIQMIKTYDYKDSIKLLRKAYDLKLEGIVLKDINSLYYAMTDKEGWVEDRDKLYRTSGWLKEKTSSLMDVIPIGYDISITGKRKGMIGSFLLAVWDKEEHQWRYVGRVGGGFDNEDLNKLKKEFDQMPKTEKPFEDINANRIRKKKGMDIFWIDPKYYDQGKIMRVRFQEYTPYLIARNPIYEGFRVDIDSKDTHLEFRKFPPKELEQIKITEDLIPIDWSIYNSE